MLQLKTLGTLLLERAGASLGGAALQKRRLSLLAVLAVAGPKGMTREKLLGLLWPDVDEARGRQALSQSLYALRRDADEDALVLGTDLLRLNTDVVTADVATFDALLASGRRAEALALYDGPFLDGVYLSAAEEFERWTATHRARLAAAAERSMEELAAAAQDAGDLPGAATWWRRLVALDPLATRANVALVSALADAGDRRGALAQLESYTRLVHDELDAEPSPAVRELGDRLRAEARRPRESDRRSAGDAPVVDDRFLIERELGRGGMAVVFLAHDQRNDRPVALKMLHAEVGAALGRERLEREIRVTARLQHPHILPLHDSGEHEGTLYYVMPFVDGGSLRGRLSQGDHLPIDEALRIAREVADALDHAHRRGVVHRDIKPENILLADGHAVVADFGIARLISDALDPALTQQGTALGTPAYMSPEQLDGARDVGPRSDVFSLGCVLFEMLAGRPPWVAASVQALFARRFTDPAPSLRTFRHDVPAWLDEVLRRALADDVEARIASAAELAKLLTGGPSRPQSNLPVSPGELIGRAREADATAALLTGSAVRLLTLTGSGGTGKTRLALHVAARVAPAFDRASFVDLSAVTDASQVMATIGASLGTRAAEGTAPETAVVEEIGLARMLLVLDNFEQVVAAAPGVARLVAECPSLTVFVTSRSRLGLRGEHEFFVAPLALGPDGSEADASAPALRLFLERALEARPDLVVDEQTRDAASAICARLDGLPLAIELAAARCRVMSPQAILARLRKGFELLSGGARDMPERHQTMRQAIDWSHELLTQPQQALFARLAVFSGGCTLGAVEAVCADGSLEIDPLAGVESLLDASLLIRDHATRGEPRLRMLETVRELASEKLARAPGELAARMAARHRAWMLERVTALAREFTGAGQGEAFDALAADHANLRAAFDGAIAAGDAAAALGFASSVWRYWLVRRGLAEGRELIGRALALPTTGAPALDGLRADAMSGAAQLAQNSGDVGEARRVFEEVLAMRRRLGDSVGEAQSLADVGWMDWRQCRFESARRLSNESLLLAERVGDDRVAALALGNLGFVFHCEGDLDAARDCFQRSADRRERLADRRGAAFMKVGLAWSCCRGNRLDEARSALDQALPALRELHDDRLSSFGLNVLADVELRTGDSQRARTILTQTLPEARRIGDQWLVAHALSIRSRAALLEQRVDEARASAVDSLEVRRRIDDRFGEAESLLLLAEVSRREMTSDRGLSFVAQAREICADIGDRIGLAECQAAITNRHERPGVA